MLLIVNLLYNKSRVSLKELCEILGVSERSIYRYINKISAGGIPVYYDKYLNGYTVADRKERAHLKFTNNDLIVFLVALKLLESQLPSALLPFLAEIKGRLLAAAPFPLEKMLMVERAIGIENAREKEILGDLIDSLIQAALILNTDLSVYADSCDGWKQMIFKSPRLEYKDGWKIAAGKEPENSAIERDDITFVRIL